MNPDEASDRRESGSGKTVLYVVLGVAAAVLLVCGGVTFLLYRMWTGFVDTAIDVVHQGTTQMVVDSDMDDRDKDLIVAQIDRVARAYKAGEITIEQVTDIMENVFQGPLIMVGVCQRLERGYVADSGLSDEERDEARITLQRLARGAFEKKITQQQFDEVTRPISTTGPEGQQMLKESLSDDELRDFLADCRQLADEAGIPDGPYEINIGEEVKQAVDEVIGDE